MTTEPSIEGRSPSGVSVPCSRRTLVLRLAASGVVAACASTPPDPGLLSEWMAVLEVGSQRLRMRLVIGSDGRASLYQDNQAIGARIARTGEELELTVGADRKLSHHAPMRSPN